MSYRIEKYQQGHYGLWNDFVSRSKNGTFLFQRGFMEYHSDRFEDFSLIVFKNEKPLAVLPANIKGNEVFSHWGLSYGGLVYDEKVKLADVIYALQVILQFLHENNVQKLHIKLVPSIYHKFPAEELNYALFVANALLVRRDSLSVCELQNMVGITKTREQSISRGRKNNLVIKEEPNFNLFWDKVLLPNLANKHNVKPVHTAKEILLLNEKFPENIRHFNVYYKDKIVAGTTLFVSDNVVHSQYISAQNNKNELGSLDYLYNYLITEAFVDKKYLDFGSSNESQGRKLNRGLTFWKESFGARTIVQDFYEINTANYSIIDAVLI